MKYLIIGGVAGGATIAARLKRNDESAQITIFERGEYVSYANCGLPYYIGGTINGREKLFVQTVEGFISRYNIGIRTKSEVEKINPKDKTIDILNLENGKRYVESYDKLILSPGAAPIRPPVPGIDHPHIFTLRNIPDTDKIKTFVSVNKVKRAIVVGGGFIGLEMAENLHDLGIEVIVVEMANQVMAPIDFSMASIVHSHLRSKGVGLILSDAVEKFEERGNLIDVRLKSGKSYEADMVIWSIGVKPENKLAKDSGLEVGSLGGIKVNEYLQTSDKDIYAVGDAIEVINPVIGKPVLIPLAGPANKQARIAADNIVYGNKVTYKGSIGTGIAKIFDLTVASTGVNAKQLSREGINYISSYTHSSSHAGYYPNALPLSIKIIFSPKNGQLLGAQVVGFDGVDKRVEMFAQVIKSNGTIYDLMEIEHAYAPPYSSAKDPVNMAGFVAENILNGKVQIQSWRSIADVDFTKDYLLDVRTLQENRLGSIYGAVNIPVDDLRSRLAEIPKDKRIIVFCAVGLRGYVAYRILTQNGFKNVYNLSGGYKTYSMAMETDPGQSILNNSKIGSDDQVDEQIDEKAKVCIDACGLQCPGPIMQLKKGYDSISVGERLEVRATDQAFAKDVSAWCNITGAKLLSVNNSKGIITAFIEKGEQSVSCKVLGGGSNKTLIMFSDDLDKALATFVIANGAASMGKKVTIFFTFWGLNVIKKKDHDKVKKDFLGRAFGLFLPSSSKSLSLSKMNMGGMGGKVMRHIMKSKNIDSLESMIKQAQSSGIEMIACTMSMDVMGIKPQELIDGVELGGVATYLERTEESNMSLFI